LRGGGGHGAQEKRIDLNGYVPTTLLT
jgi:hypothetical protein